jgi:FkbM family methyltransferase
MNLQSSIRKALTDHFPERVSRRVLQHYYLSRLKTYRERSDWESNESDLTVIKHLITPGDTVIDIGANFGFYTVYLADLVGSDGGVISCEPIPLTFSFLSHAVRQMKLHQVRLNNCAVSNLPGQAFMVVPSFDSGVQNYYQARLLGNDAPADRAKRTVPVEVMTLDAILVAATARTSFIKIDVEGHELQVVMGGETSIRELKPALLIEVSSEPDDTASTAHELVHWLREAGYSPFWYDGRKLRRRVHGDASINYFFLTPAHVNQLTHFVPVDRD